MTKLALEKLKENNPVHALAAAQLLITCMYIGMFIIDIPRLRFCYIKVFSDRVRRSVTRHGKVERNRSNDTGQSRADDRKGLGNFR